MIGNKNTKKGGVVRILIYPEKGKYIAVCLDFDIIKEGKNIVELRKEIQESIRGYIKNIVKNKLDDKLLNRLADKKYWEKYNQYLRLIKSKNEASVKVPISIRRASLYAFPLNKVCVQNIICLKN